jgi:hypothetical protein
MPDYRRHRVAGVLFFTVNLLERSPSDLLVGHIDTLREAVREVPQRWPFRVDGWVVLPDHLCCIWTLPEGDALLPLPSRERVGVTGLAEGDVSHPHPARLRSPPSPVEGEGKRRGSG